MTDADRRDSQAEKWARYKSVLLQKLLGKDHNYVMHAIMPYAVGGTLDLYMYPHGIPGTGIATQELTPAPNKGPSNDTFRSYELVMFTRHTLSEDGASPFGQALDSINAILNVTARYSEEATLNPFETAEFPADMGDASGKCVIFDAYRKHSDRVLQDFGLLLAIEIFRDEMEFARINGGEALIKRLKQHGHYPYSDLNRKPVVTRDDLYNGSDALQWNTMLAECRDNFGASPRTFSAMERWRLRIGKPVWVDSDDMKALYDHMDDLWRDGVVVWGALIQANELLFRPGRHTCPGELVYCADPNQNVHPTLLEDLAYRIASLKGTDPEDLQLAYMSHYLTDERVRVFGLSVPETLYPDGEFMISTTMFAPKHLLKRHLACGLMPIVVNPREPRVVLPLPHRYWSDRFAELWINS